MMNEYIWKFRYALRLHRFTHCGFKLAWYSAKISYDDLTSDGDIDDYSPEDSADDESSYWAE